MDIFGNSTQTINTDVNLNNFKIINLGDPVENKDAVNKEYISTQINNILPAGYNYSDYLYWNNTLNKWDREGEKIHIGASAGITGQQSGTVSIGVGAGEINQHSGSISIGTNSAQNNQSYNSVSIGLECAQNSQGESSVAVGQNSAKYSQGIGACAIGCNSSLNSQGDFACSLGFQAGMTNQPAHSVCLGANSSATLEHEVALGDNLCPQVKSHGYFVSDQGFKISSGGSSTLYFTTDGGVGMPSGSGSSNIYFYNSSTDTDLLNIANGQIRYNQTVQQNASQVCISHLTRDTIDIDAFLNLVDKSTLIYIQDQNTSLNYIKYSITSPPSISPNNFFIFNVLFLEGEGDGLTNFANGHNILLSFFANTSAIDGRLNTLETDVINLQNNKLSLDGTTMMTGSIEMQNNSIDHISYLSFNGTTNVGFLNNNNYDMAQNVLLGQGNTNNGEDQILVGTGNLSNSGSSFTLGVGYVNIADSPFGLCLGQNNTHADNQNYQINIGYNNTTSGEGAMALGSNITNNNNNSLCIGTTNMEWFFPNSAACAVGKPSNPFKEIYIDGGIIKTGGSANDLYCTDGTIDTVTINNAASALSIANSALSEANNKLSLTGGNITGNLIIYHDLYNNNRMLNGSIFANSNSLALSASGILVGSNITSVGGSNIAVTQTNTNILNKIIKVNCGVSASAAYQDSGYLGAGTFYKGSAGLYVGMGWTYNITFGIGDTNIAPGTGNYVCGMQVGFVASSTAVLWSASITPDNTVSWFGVGHNYTDSVLSFYNKGSTGAGTKVATPYGVSTPSSLYFSLTMINQFGSNDVLLILKEIITNTTMTQTYTMSGTNSVSNTTRLYPVFTRMLGATAPSGGAIISFSSMSLTA